MKFKTILLNDDSPCIGRMFDKYPNYIFSKIDGLWEAIPILQVVFEDGEIEIERYDEYLHDFVNRALRRRLNYVHTRINVYPNIIVEAPLLIVK
jgi:hypothetical protein